TVALHNMSSYASGWQISLSGNGEIYHDGYNPNFTSHIAFRQDEKVGVVVLANSNSLYTSLIANQVLKLIMGEKLDKKTRPGDNNDCFFLMLDIALMIYIFIVLIFMIGIGIDILKSKREYDGNVLKKLRNFFLLIILIF